MSIICYQSSATFDGSRLCSNTIKITGENVFQPKFYPSQTINHISIGKKKNLTSKLPLYIKMYSKLIIELNVKHKSLNCLEYNRRKCLKPRTWGKILRNNTKSTSIKEKQH